MLIIALPHKAHSSTSYNYWLSPNGLNVSLSGQAVASSLPKNSGEVVAVIPWQLVSWHAVKLPHFSHSKTPQINAVLSGMLEDELLDEVSSMHFILPSHIRSLMKADQEVVIGACSKDWLRQATNALSDQGITVQRIVCELTPIAPTYFASIASSASSSQNRAARGVSGSKNAHDLKSIASSQQSNPNFSTNTNTNTTTAPVLHILGPASNPASAVLCTAQGVIKLPYSTTEWSAFKELGSAELKVYCEPHWVQSTTQALGREPTLYNVSQRMLGAAQSIWDAATGEWEQSRGLRFWRGIEKGYLSFMHNSQWSLAKKAVLGLIAINLVGLNAWAWIESANVHARETELTKLLRETFPTIGLIVDPSLQMQRELRRLQHSKGQSAAGDLESMLAAVATLLPQNYKLQSFNYSANELRLNDVSKDLISPLGQSSLQKSGYTLRSETKTLGGQTVSVLVITFVDGVGARN